MNNDNKNSDGKLWNNLRVKMAKSFTKKYF